MIIKSNEKRELKLSVKKITGEKSELRFLGNAYKDKLEYIGFTIDSGLNPKGRFPAFFISGDEGVMLKKDEIVEISIAASMLKYIFVYCEQDILLQGYDIKII